MFNQMELRIIKYSVSNTMRIKQKQLSILDPESDDAVEISNDLMLYQSIIEKINESEKKL
tara:strand:- start:228 stop:407 length:180 start_codon:yes stop_codon:yes gene_type:complete